MENPNEISKRMLTLKRTFNAPRKLQQEQMGFYNGWGTAFNRLEDFVTAIAQ